MEGCYREVYILSSLYGMKESNYEKFYRDKGIIGEKKTREGKEVHYDEKTGLTGTIIKYGANKITPTVSGDIAKLGFDTSYYFQFSCIGWRYWINYGRQSEKNSAVIASPILLLSPDDNAEVAIKTLDLPANFINTPPTEEQRIIAKTKAVDDPFIGEERILAAQQAINWVLNNDLGRYKVIKDFPIKFTSEVIGKKEFIKTEVEVISDSDKAKICNIWALNCWGYRVDPEVKRMINWVAIIVADPTFPTTVNILKESHMILESLEFTRFNLVYSDLR